MKALLLRLFFAGMALASSALCKAAPPANAAPPTDRLARAAWSAEWITAQGAPQRDPVVLHFRKVAELQSVPQQLLVHVSADNRFVLHLNGQRVGAGPARGDIEHWRYETFDLAPYLRVGNNVLAATVWNFGLAAYAQISRRTGFILQSADEHGAAFNTNKTWQAQLEPGHGVFDKGMEAIKAHHFFYAASPAERRDGRVWNWQWDQPAGNPWPPAVGLERGTPRSIREGPPYALSPSGWLLVPNRLPPLEEAPVIVGNIVRQSGPLTLTGRFPEPEGSIKIPPRSTARILFDRREIINAYLTLVVDGGKDAVVKLTYAESLFDKQGRKGNRNEITGKDMIGFYDEYVADGAHRSFSPLWWRSWRYLELEITTAEQPLTLLQLTARSTLFPLQPLAAFQSDDPQLKQLWAMAFRTLRISAWETYMDSPYWEQLQYVGDTRITALLSYVMSNEDRLARQALEAFDHSRTSEGLTMSRYPTRDQQYIPPYSLFWVGMVHDFWMYRDDPNYVQSLLPGTRTVIDWFLRRLRGDGLPSYLSGWSHIDPAAGGARQTEDGGSAAAAGQLLAALREGAALENALGDKTRAQQYLRTAARVSRALAGLWDEQRGLVRDNPESTSFSHDVNILALWQDVFVGKRRATLAANVRALGKLPPGVPPPPGQPAPASLYFRYYLHRALNHVGHGDAFWELLFPWRQMLDMGLSTFPEFSDPTRSDSHAWTAHPALDLVNITAGITPGSPGFKTVRVAPQPGNLQRVFVQVPHSQGTIVLSLQKQANGGYAGEATLPAGLPGELVWGRRKQALRAGATTRLSLPMLP